MNTFRSVVLAIVAAVGLAVPSSALAQDDGGAMTFGEDEAKEVQEGEGEEKEGESDGSEEGAMTFGEKEAEETQKGGKAQLVGIVAVPSKAISSSQRSKLQSELATQMKMVAKKKNIEVDPSTGVLDALKKRTVATCVTEPLCLGTVGEEAGVDRIIMARVRKKEGTFTLDLDYFQVSDRLFTKYRSAEDLGGFAKVVGNVKPLLKEMFDLERRQSVDTVDRKGSGTATTVIAISSAVLSAGAIAGGAVFGNQAAQSEQKIKGHDKNDNGVYQELTQTEAQKMYKSAQAKAATANVFYGLAGAFAITSGILFLVDSGSDVAGEKQAKSGRGLPRIDIAPAAGPDGIGFSAQVSF